MILAGPFLVQNHFENESNQVKREKTAAAATATKRFAFNA